MPLRHLVSSLSDPRVARDPSSPPSTRSSRPSDTNRNASIVASIKGRARLGLLDSMFLRDLNLRVEDGEFGVRLRDVVVARCHKV